MVWYSKFIIFLTRPLLIPMAIGTIGMWYGAFDVSRFICRKAFPVSQVSKRNQLLAFFSSFSASAVILYMGKDKILSGPNNDKLKMPEFTVNLQSFVKASTDYFKRFPGKNVVIALMATGGISGLICGTIEWNLSDEKKQQITYS